MQKEIIQLQAQFLFEIKSKQDWINRAPFHLNPLHKFVWIDKNGNAYNNGGDFSVSQKIKSFPCKVYRLITVSEAFNSQQLTAHSQQPTANSQQLTANSEISYSTIIEIIEIVRRDTDSITTALNDAFTMENASAELDRMNHQINKNKEILNELSNFLVTLKKS